MTDSPSPRSHQLSAESWLRMGACKTTCALCWNSSYLCETTRALCWDTGWLCKTNHALHTGTLAGLSTCRSCTDNHSFCELIGAVVPPCPEDTVSLQSSPMSGSHNLSTSFFMVIPEPQGRRGDDTGHGHCCSICGWAFHRRPTLCILTVVSFLC